MSDCFTQKEIGQWLMVAEPSPGDIDDVLRLKVRCHLNGERVSARWWNINEGWVDRKVSPVFGSPLIRSYGTVTLAFGSYFGQPGVAEWLHENDIDFHFTATGALAFASDNERDLFILRWKQ